MLVARSSNELLIAEYLAIALLIKKYLGTKKTRSSIVLLVAVKLGAI